MAESCRLSFLSYPFDTVASHRHRKEVVVTAPEVYTALFWLVAGSYLISLGWTLYRVVVERLARRRHPSSLPHEVGEMSRDESEGAFFSSHEVGEMSRNETEGAFFSGHEVGEKPESSVSPSSLVEFLFD
jgi:hypothetical protein